MNIKDAYIHNGDAILKDIQLSGSKLQKLKAGKNADDTYLTWVDVLDLSPFGASGHNHDDRYVKLNGDSVMTGDLNLSLGNVDRFVVFSYLGTTNPTSNSWRTGVLGSGSDEANYYVVQYQQINASSSTWNTAFKIGQSTGNVTFTNNITIGDKVNYHAGNLSIKTLMGTTAIGDSDEPIYWNGSSFVKAGAYPTKSSWNYDDRYLKLSGGNLTGGLSIQTQNYEKDCATSQQLVINGPDYDANATLTPQSYPGIGFHMPNITWANLIWNGSFTGMDGSFNEYVSFYGSGFKKDGSSDNYVLLGGGGHKLISDFSMSHSHPYLPTTQVVQEQNSNDDWIKAHALSTLRGHVYNTHNLEWQYLFGISSGKTYGSILRTSYGNGTPRIQVMGLFNGTWSSWREVAYDDNTVKKDGTGASGTWSINISGNAATATTSTYASNIGTSGTAGTNYVTAANVISMYNWYNSITATDEASNTAIDKWNEIVSFLTGITDTSTLSGILAGYAAAGHNHDKTYLKLTGGTLTGSKNVLTLSNNSGGDIGLKFSRNFILLGK